MRLRRLLVIIPCALALMFALVGCSGEGGQQASEKQREESTAAFSGTWDLIRSNDGSRIVEQNEIEQLRARGLSVYLQLDEGGSAYLNLFGDERGGTWTPETAEKATLTFDDENIPMTLSDGTLSLTEGVNQLDFTKHEEEEAEVEGEGETETGAEGEVVEEETVLEFDQTEPLSGTVIADDDTLSITLDQKASNAQGAGFVTTITNKFDQTIHVTADEGGFTMGEQEIPMTGTYDIAPGETLTAFFWAPADQLPSAELGDLQGIQGLLTVTNEGGNEVLGTFTVQF